MPVTRAKKAEVAQRRHAVADLYVQGHSQADIAKSMGVSPATISNDLHYIQGKWRESAVKDVGLVRMRELEKLERIERESWAAWQRSQRPSQEAVITSDGTTQKTQKKIAEQCGDPRFLEQIGKCIAARRALLGLDAPTKVAPTSPDGTESYASQVMSELIRLAEQSTVGPIVIDGDVIERASQQPRLEHAALSTEGLVNDDVPASLAESDAA